MVVPWCMSHIQGREPLVRPSAGPRGEKGWLAWLSGSAIALLATHSLGIGCPQVTLCLCNYTDKVGG
jgi:hypothetical protein